MNFRLTPEQLLNIQIGAFRNALPETVIVGKNKKEVKLSDKEKRAAELAIWYVLKRSWGINNAVQTASGSIGGCNKSNVKRAVSRVFPENYAQALERSKNYNFSKSLQEEQENESL